MPDNKFIELKKEFQDHYALMKLKGIYPYEYITSFETLNETFLPSIDKFHSSLNLSDITENEYERAQQVWTTFGCKTLWDYTILYLKQDVCILADALENFRTLFQLDPSHFVSSPGLTYDLCLYKTGINLDLLTDQSMYEMIESGIRGGISSVMGKRYVKANNKYTNPDCDLYYYPEQHEFDKIIKDFNAGECDIDLSNYFKKNHLLYIDANNLYGHSMSQYMPYKNFRWIEPKDFDIYHLLNHPPDSDIGYIFEVDLEYTDKESTKRFPLCPEKKKVNINYFSTNQRKIIETEHKTLGELLICDVTDKTN